MTDSLTWSDVTHADVVRAIKEYDRLGPERFFSEHGFARTTTYELVWDKRRYPPKAILGTAYEFATGRRLASADFEGGKAAQCPRRAWIHDPGPSGDQPRRAGSRVPTVLPMSRASRGI